MNFRVALTARAERERDAAFRWYLDNYSEEFAVRWYNGIADAVESLSTSPLRCGIAHESDKFTFELRELLYGRGHHKHRIVFTVRNELVLVMHIRHSAQQDLTELDF